MDVKWIIWRKSTKTNLYGIYESNFIIYEFSLHTYIYVLLFHVCNSIALEVSVRSKNCSWRAAGQLRWKRGLWGTPCGYLTQMLRRCWWKGLGFTHGMAGWRGVEDNNVFGEKLKKPRSGYHLLYPHECWSNWEWQRVQWPRAGGMTRWQLPGGVVGSSAR